ncbi:hypothetical protein D3C77_594430 [compost metagenome]
MKGHRRQLLLAGKLGLQSPLFVMLHNDVDGIAHLRMQLPQLRQFPDGQQQLAAESHLEKAAKTGMYIRHFQESKFA